MRKTCILLGSQTQRSATSNALRVSSISDLYNSASRCVAVLLRGPGRHGDPPDIPRQCSTNEPSPIPA